MTLPGRSTTTVDQPAPRGPRLRLATPFVIAETAVDADGIDAVSSIRSLRDFTTVAGARDVDNAAAYDWFEAHFQEGGAAGYLIGLDPEATITTAEITAAAELVGDEYGPGAFVTPGRTDTATILAVAAVAVASEHGKRMVRADLADTATVATLTTAAATLRASANADVLDIGGVWVSIPGLANGTARSVPFSALRSGCEGRNDKAGISPNQPAAGQWGIARYCIAPLHEWGATDRETLNDAGVNIARTIDSTLRLYGSRTAVNPTVTPAAIRIGSARLRMAIIELVDFEMERTAFAEIDQGGVELGNLTERSRARINQYQRSLYQLDITAELEEDETPGTYVVEVDVTFQAAPDAERVHATITRAVTEV